MCEPINVLLQLLKIYGIGCGFAAITVALWNNIVKKPEDLLHPAFVFWSWPVAILGIICLPFVVVRFIYDKCKPYIDILFHYKDEN